jgi:HAD superfamily hydrolase (TIGR01549 family)
VIFDLDNTLITSTLCFDTIKEALDIPKNSFILEYLESLDDELYQEKSKLLEQMELEFAEDAKLIADADVFLNKLSSKGIKTGILTRNCKSVTEKIIKKFNLPINHYITREMAAPKPAPEGLMIFLNLWELEPSEVLFIGDFHFDIDCGKNAKVKTALFTNNNETDQNFGADFIISNFSLLL